MQSWNLKAGGQLVREVALLHLFASKEAVACKNMYKGWVVKTNHFSTQEGRCKISIHTMPVFTSRVLSDKTLHNYFIKNKHIDPDYLLYTQIHITMRSGKGKCTLLTGHKM